MTMTMTMTRDEALRFIAAEHVCHTHGELMRARTISGDGQTEVYCPVCMRAKIDTALSIIRETGGFPDGTP